MLTHHNESKRNCNFHYMLFASLLSSPSSSSWLKLNNPDMRVVIIKEFAKKHFPACPLLDYALAVEKITTAKVREGHMTVT